MLHKMPTKRILVDWVICDLRFLSLDKVKNVHIVSLLVVEPVRASRVTSSLSPATPVII